MRIKCHAKGCQNKVTVSEWIYGKMEEPFVLCKDCELRFQRTNDIFALALEEKII